MSMKKPHLALSFVICEAVVYLHIWACSVDIDGVYSFQFGFTGFVGENNQKWQPKTKTDNFQRN